MNLVEGYQGKRITIVTVDQYGTTQEKEIPIGKCKGLLLVKAGTKDRPCLEDELREIHNAISEAYRNASDESNIVCTVPYYISIEYIRM
jgi:hypothetical protein